ncbi:MAG: hypothetical protein ACU837_16140 [Gammaproteobacteria bacterium]
MDTLCDELRSAGDQDAAGQLADHMATHSKNDSFAALQLLIREAEKQNKRLLILVDNFDLILNRLKNERRQLLEILRCTPRILLIGTGTPNVASKESKSFLQAGIFHVDELKALNAQEMFDTLRSLAKINNAALV